MNYYGYILKPDLISASQSGQIIKASLSKLYQEGRFLGAFDYHFDADFHYVDSNEGDFQHFTGKEWIEFRNECVYELVYHGGLIK